MGDTVQVTNPVTVDVVASKAQEFTTKVQEYNTKITNIEGKLRPIPAKIRDLMRTQKESLEEIIKGLQEQLKEAKEAIKMSGEDSDGKLKLATEKHESQLQELLNILNQLSNGLDTIEKEADNIEQAITDVSPAPAPPAVEPGTVTPAVVPDPTAPVAVEPTPDVVPEPAPAPVAGSDLEKPESAAGSDLKEPESEVAPAAVTTEEGMAGPKQLPLETPSIDKYITIKGADTKIDSTPEGMNITVGEMFDTLKKEADKDPEVRGALNVLEEQMETEAKQEGVNLTPEDIFAEMVAYIPGTNEYKERKLGTASVGGLKTRRRRKRRRRSRRR